MKKLLLLILAFIPCTLFATTPTEPAPIDQAFQFSATAKDDQTIIGIWQIKKGYYLYRDRIHFSAIKPERDRLGQPLWPQMDSYKEYPGIGKLAVYTGRLQISIPVLYSADNTIFVRVTYQGCSEAGYCYPPTSKTVQINLAGNYMQPVQPLSIDVAPPDVTLNLPSTPPRNDTQQLLQQKNIFIILVSFLGFGLLLSLTPCVLPMIPILSSIIAGQHPTSHSRAFILSLMYVLGMAMTYAIAGVLFGFIGGTLQAAFQRPWIIVLFSLIFVAMALSLFGLYEIQLPERWRACVAKASNRQKPGNYLSTAIMGCLSALIVSPCVTPPLVGALAYISHTGNASIGGIALFTMGIGMGAPLLVIGVFGSKLLPKAGPWMNTIKAILGVLLLAVAIWMLSRILPGSIIMILWAALALGCAVGLGIFSSAKNKRQIVGKTLGILLFIYGIILIIGALLGNSNPLAPINLTHQGTQEKDTLKFIPVKTVENVQQQLQIAQAKHKPVMLDFYADWCVSCKEMERFTFGNHDVQRALSGFHLIRADVTKNDQEDKQLEHYFHVVAPPTILFFDKQGHEIKDSRIIGEMSAKVFLRHLRQIEKDVKMY